MGWTILAEANIYGSIEDLRKVPLAKEFQEYSEQDLLAVRSCGASVAPPTGTCVHVCSGRTRKLRVMVS